MGDTNGQMGRFKMQTERSYFQRRKYEVKAELMQQPEHLSMEPC